MGRPPASAGPLWVLWTVTKTWNMEAYSQAVRRPEEPLARARLMMAVNKPTAQTHASRVRLNLFSSPSTKRVALHIQGVRDEVEGGLVPDAGMVRQAELKQQHAANMHYFLPYVSFSVRIVDLGVHSCFKVDLPRGAVDDVCWGRTPVRGLR